MDSPEDRVVADRYLLHEPVGRGGMGVVWRADDRLLGRPVAVKEVGFEPGLSGEEREAVQARVMREARAAAMLNHAGAVTVYDVAEDDGRAFIVMELVEAPTLAELVRDGGPLTPAEVARIGLAVLDVLAAAHAAGIVHRDLKPGNVMVAGDHVKLTDFGIATVKDDPRLTSTGIVLGSPSYIAPEQALGREVTPATDLWGLGATLFYAVCGRPPFDRGEPIATLTSVAHDDVEVDSCAGPLGAVLARMLAKDPTARPGVADLRAMLSAVADAETGTLAVPVAPPRTDPAPTLPAPVVTEAARVAPSPPGSRRGSRARWLVPLVLLALVAGVVVAVRRAGPAAHGATGASAVPTGFTTYRDPAGGYVVAYPRGWSVERRSASTTDFREPGTGRYLRVGFTTTPGSDPVAAWRSGAQAFARSHGGYEEVRIEPWHDGTTLHAVDLGFVTGGKGYALNFQTHEDDWARSQGLWGQLKAAFRPA
jgi:eukaryotic-like serine/threonine-protein kinase